MFYSCPSDDQKREISSDNAVENQGAYATSIEAQVFWQSDDRNQEELSKGNQGSNVPILLSSEFQSPRTAIRHSIHMSLRGVIFANLQHPPNIRLRMSVQSAKETSERSNTELMHKD